MTKTKFVASSLIRAMVEPRLPDWVEAHWYVTKEEAMELAPLAEIAPDCRVPGRGTVAAWLPAVRMQRIERLGPDDELGASQRRLNDRTFKR